MLERMESRDGMRIDWDVAVPMDDDIVLRADVFRPEGGGRHPVILAYGPYAKGLAFQEGYRDQWEIMAATHPDVTAGSSNKYQNWEVVDPEKWVPEGYRLRAARLPGRGAIARVSGRLLSARDARSLHVHRVGRIPLLEHRKGGLLGISYYAINQWHVASLQPPHWPPSARGKAPPTGTGT